MNRNTQQVTFGAPSVCRLSFNRKSSSVLSTKPTKNTYNSPPFTHETDGLIARQRDRAAENAREQETSTDSVFWCFNVQYYARRTAFYRIHSYPSYLAPRLYTIHHMNARFARATVNSVFCKQLIRSVRHLNVLPISVKKK